MLNRALAARRLAHSQRQISLSVFRPYAHVVRSEPFDSLHLVGTGVYSWVRLAISSQTFWMKASSSMVEVSPLRSRTEMLPASASLAPSTSI